MLETQGTPEEVTTSAVKPTQERDRWSNRLAFYFAAIGAAIGFGNVWRFPALAYEYGGGAFFIPYLMALFIVGIPILILEVGMGQFFQCGDLGVFGGFNWRMSGIGVSSVACAFMVVTYYSMLIAWVTHAFFDSFTAEGKAVWTDREVDGEKAVGYFLNEIIGVSTLPEDGRPTRLVGANIGYSLLTWFCIFIGIGFGVKMTGIISYVTMGIPLVLLFVFLGRACTLPGASDGIMAYCGEWDMSVLTERGEVWSAAVAQVFFSLSVTYGVMTAYGSYLKRNEPAVLNSCVIAFSDSMFSFISGFAVFASLGHLSYLSGIPISDLPYSGFSLVFGTWPVVFGTLPGGIHWVRLLFLDLWMLGIDSGFSLVEPIITVFLDSARYQHIPKWKATLFASIIGWLLSFIYATDAGLIFLDVIDFYINFTMLIVGFFECFAAGWVYGWKDQFDMLGQGAVVSHFIANFGSVSLACGIWFGVPSDQGGVWGGFTALIGFYLAGMGVACYFLKKKMMEEPDKWTWKSILWELVFGNIFALRDRIQPVIRWLPSVWCVLIKQLLPHVLLILFVNLAQTETEAGDSIFGGYGGYVTKPFQVLGILTFVFAASLIVASIVYPSVYDPLALPAGHFALDPEGEAEKLKDSTANLFDSGGEGPEGTPEDTEGAVDEAAGEVNYIADLAGSNS